MESPDTTGNAIINEWGEYIVKSEDIIRLEVDDALAIIDVDHVLDSIQQNNPAITAVEVAGGVDDWRQAGKIIG
jgi:hypothetical protein